MHLSAQIQKCAPTRHPGSRSVIDRNVKQSATTSRGTSSLAQSSSSDSLRKQPNKPIRSLRRSKSDPATHTLVQTSLLSLTLNPDAPHPIPQNDFPSWVHQSSEAHSEIEMAHFVSQILAQKKGLESDVCALSSTLSNERNILFRLWNINPSLPIDSLMRLLLLSQEKAERTARLKAIQQAQIDLRHRLTLVDDRQSYLDARERSLSSKALEACRSSFINRRAGIRRERSQLEAEVTLRERQESDLRGDIQSLECEEADYWRALERMSSSSASASGAAQARPPKLKDPTSLISKSALRVTMYYNDDVEADAMGGEVEGAGQLDVIPEIPDSPPTSVLPLPNTSNIPELAISVDHTFVDGLPDSSGSTDLQWRQSSSGSSGVDSSLIGPQTPRTMVHDDRSSIIVNGTGGARNDGSVDDAHWKFPSNRDSTISHPARSSNDFRKTIHFPSFNIPPLASPPDTLETDTPLLRTSAYSIISSPLSAIDNNPSEEGTSPNTQSRSAFLGPIARTQSTGRHRTVQNKFSRPTSEVPVAAEQRPIPNWGIFKNILGAPRRLRKSKSGNTAGVAQENSSGTLGAAADDQVAST